MPNKEHNIKQFNCEIQSFYLEPSRRKHLLKKKPTCPIQHWLKYIENYNNLKYPRKALGLTRGFPL